MSAETSQLTTIVAQIIDHHSDEPRISPTKIATLAMGTLNALWMQSPKQYPLVYLGCHLELRQIARSVLRSRFEPEEDADKITHPLFPDLQWRYPMMRREDAEPQYVLLDLLTQDDWRFNIKRLEADAASRLAHADKLRAWGHSKFFHHDPVA